MKTVNISGWVAKLAWDKTVGGTQCVQSLQTGSQLGPKLWQEGLGVVWRISRSRTGF